MKELANGSVPIPFGEYTIRLRNKHNRRAVCKVSIDGENISGEGFIIGANSFIDIERPIDVDRKFKFVSLDSEDAYNHGKNGPNHDKIKGVISADFSLEREKQYLNISVPIVTKTPYRPDPYNYLYWYHRNQPIGCSLSGRGLKSESLNLGEVDTYGPMMTKCSFQSQVDGGELMSSGVNLAGSLNNMSATYDSCAVNTPLLKDGATVEGSSSSQRFSSVYFDAENSVTTVKLFLKGFDPLANAVANILTTNVLSVNQGEPTWRTIEEVQQELDIARMEKELEKLKYKEKLQKEITDLQAKLAAV